MEEVTLVKTKDGKLHKTEEEAQEHIVDQIRSALDTHFRGIHDVYPWLNRSHVMDIIEYIAKDYKTVQCLVNTLNKTFE